jgi:hypothetical protein
VQVKITEGGFDEQQFRSAVASGNPPDLVYVDPKIPEFLPMWVRANGGAMLSDDGKSAQLNDPKVVEALTTTTGIVQASGGWDRLKSLRDSFAFPGAKNQVVKDHGAVRVAGVGVAAAPGLRVRHLAAAGAVRAPGQWEVVLAASVIATVPMLFIFFLGQRYFVEGIATTGRKG